MNKKIIYIVIGAIVILLALGFWYKNSKNLLVDSNENAKKGIELCFAKFGEINKQGFYDKYTLKMLLDGEKVTGELKFLPAEKDSKLGKFEGSVSAVDKMSMTRTVNAVWYTFAEGMNNKEELSIIFGEGIANVGFGEMVKKSDGMYGYKNPKDIKYSLELNDVACGDIDEREVVENYLRLNIAKLSPVKAVLGGTWYVVSVFVDMSRNEGGVVYEDGHIQEKRTFNYNTNEKGEVVSLSII